MDDVTRRRTRWPRTRKGHDQRAGSFSYPKIYRGAVQEDRHVPRYRTSILPCPPSVLPIRTTPPSNKHEK